jgi:DNA replication protein DnaC
MSDLTTPAAAALKLEETTIVGCDGMLEFLKQEESTIYLKGTLDPLFDKTREKFLPESIYVRKEMCDVFAELTREKRDEKQILIGSPGVGKSVLLFLVALYRALTEGKPCCFIRPSCR